MISAQDTPRVLSAHDTLRLNVVGSPRLSPDGSWVLYTLRTRNLEGEHLDATTHLWRVRIDGSDNHQLTRGAENATDPAWSPDGSLIAFLAARGPGPSPTQQVYLMRADGGEAWPATDHEEDIAGFHFSRGCVCEGPAGVNGAAWPCDAL